MTRPEVEGSVGSPTNIPGYEFLELVGEGGTGRVYRARQLSLQRIVAIKVFPLSSGLCPPAAFERETRLLASLAHPNLVTVFDCGEVNGHHYIVTEFIEGSTLRPLITPGKPWPLDPALYVLDRLASALTYIHAKGVLHLDLKPENILCDTAGKPKIADFGLALPATDVPELVERGETEGTPDYCAPEQRFGLPTNERSDLFSLAVIAYELLTGSLPGRVYESARRFNPALPPRVDRVLRRGLARSQEDRFAKVEDFQRELLTALNVWPSPYRRRFGLAAAIALIIALTVASLRPQPPRASDPPSTPPETVQSWVLHDIPDQLHWFDLGEESTRPWLVEGRLAGASGSPPLPVWPLTRPVMVVASAEAMGFIHPLTDPTLGRKVLKAWPALSGSPPSPPENNFCLAGDFSRDCLAVDHEDKTRPWHLTDPAVVTAGNVVVLADPPDRPANPALLLHKKDGFSPIQEIGCYQWLSRVPDRPGTVVVMRYKARAEEGEGRLTARFELPLVLPADAADETARRLRELSFPFPVLPHGPADEPRQYRIEDWVTPGREWRSYYVIVEWPPYCQLPDVRNVVVLFAGTGKVWLDDLEVYTWELGKQP